MSAIETAPAASPRRRTGVSSSVPIDLAHRRRRERHGDAVEIEFGQTGDDIARHGRRRCAATRGRRPRPARAMSARRCGPRSIAPRAFVARRPRRSPWQLRRRSGCATARPASAADPVASVSAISRAVGAPSRIVSPPLSAGGVGGRQPCRWPRDQSASLTRPSERHSVVHCPTRRGAPESPNGYSGATDSSRNTLGRSHSPTTPSTRWRSTWPATEPSSRSTAPPDQAMPARCNSSWTGRRYDWAAQITAMSSAGTPSSISAAHHLTTCAHLFVGVGQETTRGAATAGGSGTSPQPSSRVVGSTTCRWPRARPTRARHCG